MFRYNQGVENIAKPDDIELLQLTAALVTRVNEIYNVWMGINGVVMEGALITPAGLNVKNISTYLNTIKRVIESIRNQLAG